jgi:hypothetical protein
MDLLLTILFAIFQFLGKLLFDWYGWIVVVAVLGFFIWQNVRKQRWVTGSESTLLMLEVPRNNDKRELSAEQLFASLHGILRPKQELIKEGAIQEHISFEIAAVNQQIRFYIWAPRHLRNFIEGQVYAQYPSVNIAEVPEDYARQELPEGYIAQSMELQLANADYLPIQTFNSFEVDPLGGITAVLAKLEEPGEQAWIQILARPIDDSWHRKGEAFIARLKGGGAGGGNKLQKLLGDFFVALWRPPAGSSEGSSQPELSDQQKAMIQSANDKIAKLGYEVKIRFVHIGTDRNLTRLRMQALFGAFKQFNDVTNSFKVGTRASGEEAVKHYRARLFLKRGSILNIEELASLYHLPHTNVETPNMVWANNKTAEPPSNLPSVESVPQEELSPVGVTDFRGHNHQFGIKRSDRGRHVYVVGQTGTGKTYLMLLLTLSDIYQGSGFAVIDPHGDFSADVLRYIPQHRVQDVVYFNPADTEYPIAFNPLEVTDPSLKSHISSEVVGALKRMFGYSWGPRLEYILRYTILALLDYPNATLLGITRMLTEKPFRDDVIAHIQDPVVKNFWVNEFASWNEKFASEAVAPILNKIGAFTANPLVRNIIGQPQSAFSIRSIMDEGKIMIINLSRGQVGEDNAATLGALLVTKVQLAAMSRANITHLENRRPFNLYVDEFQNFATDSFAVILSEARKYGLNLTIANQYISQMSQEVRDAVFGNVGSIVSFRVSADDAPYLARYFSPTFEDDDLIRLHNQHFIINMNIDGEKAPPFTAHSLRVPDIETDYIPSIIEHSRTHFASARSNVEAMIRSWTNVDEQKPNNQNNNPRPQNNNNNGQQKQQNGQKARQQAPQKDKQTGTRRSGNQKPKQQQPQQQPSNPDPANNQVQDGPTKDAGIQPEQTVKLRKRR